MTVRGIETLRVPRDKYRNGRLVLAAGCLSARFCDNHYRLNEQGSAESELSMYLLRRPFSPSPLGRHGHFQAAACALFPLVPIAVPATGLTGSGGDVLDAEHFARIGHADIVVVADRKGEAASAVVASGIVSVGVVRRARGYVSTFTRVGAAPSVLSGVVRGV